MSVHKGRSRRVLYSAGAVFQHLKDQTVLAPIDSSFEKQSFLALFSIIVGMGISTTGIITGNKFITYIGFGEMTCIILLMLYQIRCRN